MFICHYLPSDFSHVVSVQEEERSEDASDTDMVLLSDGYSQSLRIHHHQNYRLQDYSKGRTVMK